MDEIKKILEELKKKLEATKKKSLRDFSREEDNFSCVPHFFARNNIVFSPFSNFSRIAPKERKKLQEANIQEKINLLEEILVKNLTVSEEEKTKKEEMKKELEKDIKLIERVLVILQNQKKEAI